MAAEDTKPESEEKPKSKRRKKPTTEAAPPPPTPAPPPPKPTPKVVCHTKDGPKPLDEVKAAPTLTGPASLANPNVRVVKPKGSAK